MNVRVRETVQLSVVNEATEIVNTGIVPSKANFAVIRLFGTRRGGLSDHNTCQDVASILPSRLAPSHHSAPLAANWQMFSMKFLTHVVIRLMIPLCVLAAGVYGYVLLSEEPERKEAEAPADQIVRTRVQFLTTGDYPIRIVTHGVVSPHNRVTLSAEVTGTIKTTYPAMEVGSYFKAGDLLLEIDDRDYQTSLKIAREENQLAEATLKLNQAAYGRMKQLVERDSASSLELDQTFASLVQARSEVEISASTIDQALRNLERTKIVAPFDGRVATKIVGEGQLVSAGTPLGDVFAVDYAEVRLPIASRELKHVSLPEMEGDPPVALELRDAINDSSDAVWQAKIVRTEGVLDAGSLELFAIARVDDPFALNSKHRVLRIGQPVIASIQGETLRDVVAIPRAAVRRMDLVYLIDGTKQTIRSLTIDPLWSDADHLVVHQNVIEPGELLATTTLVYAPEGSTVEIIPEVDAGEAFAGKPSPLEPTP
ncbi:RND family efflux transporter, MFP subunit [Neorhodopirellula lusitana]|uniref:RND family efflux transporter, MFP subunit n=1 Tax=Neorhodopirellula lusitana TaxID=445327 RepID=A0ABY1Q5D2_9BACT|nr:RND family efflux transporter, MFP subunit [Neorhodopirellula lusitana]